MLLLDEKPEDLPKKLKKCKKLKFYNYDKYFNNTIFISNKMTDITQFSNFLVESQEIPNPFGGSIKRTQLVFKRLLDEQIIKTLGNLLDSDDEIYNDPVKISPDDLYPHLRTIQSKIEHSGDYSLIELSSWLNEYYKEKREQLDRMELDGKINFANLESIIGIGTKCIGMIQDQFVGFIVSRIDREVDDFGQKFFSVMGKLTASYGDKFKQFDKKFVIPEFRGAKDPSSLPVRQITDEELTKLTERGKKLIKYGKSGTYVSYTGNMFRQTPYGIYKFRADGRCMIDPIGFTKKMPIYSKTYGLTDCEDVPEDLMFMCYPFVNGFSFTTKDWGEMYVDQLEDVKFDDKAFDYLVLDESIKQMIRALVVNSEGTFTDIIQKKSGGTIICLNGSPGIGKTLTSQSLAEMLHKPLYSVSVGELGTTVEALEKRLADVLEIAHAWNAIILLDEADIFMEKRASNDIQRNAMVSIFLRLLENYQGIMFLTTNRPENLDLAFKSRISISINYKDLDENARYKVWINLLEASNTHLSQEDIIQLSKVEMNGREIKNCIRMGQCLAKESKEELSIKIIEQVIPFVI